MKIGTSYYPEDLKESDWRVDLTNMKEAGLSLLRIGEFAWSVLEPREGVYDFEWLKKFLDLANELGFRVVMCTPSATPPAWMTTQYPDMMVIIRSGHRRGPGGRRDADLENDVYRHFCVEICTKLGEAFGDHPAVIGWQIDNELIGPEGVPPEVHTAAVTFRFRQYLKAVHGTVDVLNDRWGTTFWSQRYSDWGELSTPLNPRSTMGQVLDYSRYFSDSMKKFIILQRDALRKVISKVVWISHNSTAIFDRGLDHADWAQELDVCGWDAYFGAAYGYRPAVSSSLAHDFFRSAKRQPFWIFETASADESSTPAYWGQMRAQEAIGIIFWHWRSHRANAESGTNTICDHAGRPYADRVARLKSILARPELKDEPTAPSPQRRAAILFCPDCVRMSLSPDPYIKPPLVPYLKVVIDTYAALWNGGVNADVVRPGQSLDGYELLLMPSAAVLSVEAAAEIRRFVERGGNLVAVAKTAHRDQWAKWYTQPGEPLVDVLGFTCRRETRTDADQYIRQDADPAHLIDCGPHVERLEPTTATVTARFSGGPLDGSPAALINTFGKGRVWYAAGFAPVLIHDLVRQACARAKIKYVAHSHENVSIVTNADRTWVFNHSDEEVHTSAGVVPAKDFITLPAGTDLTISADAVE